MILDTHTHNVLGLKGDELEAAWIAIWDVSSSIIMRAVYCSNSVLGCGKLVAAHLLRNNDATHAVVFVPDSNSSSSRAQVLECAMKWERAKTMILAQLCAAPLRSHSAAAPIAGGMRF